MRKVGILILRSDYFSRFSVQFFIKCGKSDLHEKEEWAVFGRCKEWKTKEKEFAQLNEFPRFV